MNFKQILAPALLVFVGISLGWIVIGEREREPAPEPTDETDLTAVLPESLEAPKLAEKPDHRLIAYYFHGKVRCPTCLAIEQGARETLVASFPEAFEMGLIEWEAVNTDEAWNAHYLTDFELSFSSLVIAEVSGSETVRWKNLHRVWQLVQDKAGFHDYVEQETQSFLEQL